MFGETSLEQFQGRGMNQARNQRQNMWSWKCMQHFPPKRLYVFKRLQGVISQKAELRFSYHCRSEVVLYKLLLLLLLLHCAVSVIGFAAVGTAHK
jgi:hypothetical protein